MNRAHGKADKQRLTRWKAPGELIASAWGLISYKHWCAKVIEEADVGELRWLCEKIGYIAVFSDRVIKPVTTRPEAVQGKMPRFV